MPSVYESFDCDGGDPEGNDADSVSRREFVEYKNGILIWNFIVLIVGMMLIAEVVSLRQEFARQPQILKVK